MAFKHFLLLLNRLQQTFEFAFYKGPSDDSLVEWLRSGDVLDVDNQKATPRVC